MIFNIKIPVHYLVFFAGGFSTLQTGLYFGWFSFAMPKFGSDNSPIRISNDEGSWMASIFLIGTMVGGILIGLTIDVFGRKRMLLVASMPLCGCWLVIAFAQKSWQLHLASGVLGISDGMLYSCLPLYIAEVCDPNIRLFTGNVGITLYAQTVFNEFEGVLNPVISLTIYCLLELTVIVVVGMLVDKVGRRFLVLSSISAVFVATSIISIYFTFEDISHIDVNNFSWVPIFGLFLYVIGFAFGLMNVPFILIGELFPPRVKSCASTAFTVFYGLISVTSTKVFQYTKDEYGMYVPFIIFACIALCGIPFVTFCIPETKKKTLEEIQIELQSNHNL
ncbi:hypothetical protein FQR65_LT01930 [Abscondita terminalis]|nr:hypothetical protein FQR65_LT01930 [Abscondita terminalis]